MVAAPPRAMTIDGPTSATQRSRQTFLSRSRDWLPAVLFAVLIASQSVARTGEFGGFVDSSKPARSPSQTFTTADGYVTFWDGIPVNGDAMSFLVLTRFLQGQHGPQGTGIYDHRAGYSYVGALAALFAGHYYSFVALNALAWLAAALSMYWLAVRLLGSRLAGWIAGTLTATGQGFSFMVGTPVSTLFSFAGVAMVLAFVEWCGLLKPPFRWRDWLHTGWLLAVVSLLYPVYLSLLACIWLTGLRSAPFTRLISLSAVALVLAQAWTVVGQVLVGLEFDTTNSGVLAEALSSWWSALLRGPSAFLNQMRLVASAGTIYAAFPGAMLLAAAFGYLAAGPPVRHWALAVCLAMLMSALIFAIRFAIPRAAFFAYPAVYILAAAGLARIATATVTLRPRGVLPVVAVILGLFLLAAPSAVALVGYGDYDSIFHFWTQRWSVVADR